MPDFHPTHDDETHEEKPRLRLADEVQAGARIKVIGVGGGGSNAVNRLIRAGYDLLGLITFFTAGPKESRAWTVTKGARAPQAAGVIHTDFDKGCIKAEIVSYDDLIAAGSMAAAKAAGKVRMEGKDYVMADGDVVEFRFQPTSGGKAAAK